jgi:hypothetical protein
MRDALSGGEILAYHSTVVLVGELEFQDFLSIFVKMSLVIVSIRIYLLKWELKLTNINTSRSNFIVDELS